MKNRKTSVKSISLYPSSILDSNNSEITGQSSRFSQQLLNHYKNKTIKLEKDFESLLDTLDGIKTACDLSSELERELRVRNEEISKLQQVVGDLQVHLFREKEQNVKLSSENEQLQIQDFENRKKINFLLNLSGTGEKKFLHFITATTQDKFVPTKLPPKLQRLKEEKLKELTGQKDNSKGDLNEEVDPEVLLLNNKLLTSQLDHHKKTSKDYINMLLNEKQVSDEERKIERQRFQNDMDLLSLKLKKTQDLLCETTGKLIESQRSFEKEKTAWMEEREKFVRAINVLKEKFGEEIADIVGYCTSAVGRSKTRSCIDNGAAKEKEKLIEREQKDAFYQKQILALEAEVNRLRERARICRNTFKEKTEKMTAQVTYLKNKYEDLDRRRHLEAEGFRTDIRMLRERLKELEKKLAKASSGLQSNEQQQLLISARNTLNRAKQLEKELAYMKSKISALDSNEDQSGS